MMAGIYITGIQMPVGEEMLCLNIHPDGKVTQHFELRCDGIGRAFPVPDHGRLVDADAFREEMDNRYPFDKFTQSKHGEADAAKGTIIMMLANAPSIIPADKEGEA